MLKASGALQAGNAFNAKFVPGERHGFDVRNDLINPGLETGSSWIPRMKPEVRNRSLLFGGQHQPWPTKMIET